MTLTYSCHILFIHCQGLIPTKALTNHCPTDVQFDNLKKAVLRQWFYTDHSVIKTVISEHVIFNYTIKLSDIHGHVVTKTIVFYWNQC
jgi:hypothetical protein